MAALENAELSPGARVYLEFPASTPPALRPGWQMLKQTRVGDVGARLLERIG